MTDPNHPASSDEFLSRLYDGELAPADRTAFERHRAQCPKCRAAADLFERSLAAFRESPVAPAAPDLSARILRKIRAQSPSRRPFGVMFGIDVRWAGVLAAALIVLLIGTPIVFHRPAGQRYASPPSLSVRLIDTPAEERPRSAPARPAPLAAPRDEVAAAAPPPAAKDEAVANNAAPRAKAETREAPSDDERLRFAPAPAAPAAPALAQAKPAPRAMVSREPSGGEGGAPSSADAADRIEMRLLIGPFDGEGTAPALVSAPADARLAPLHGREFVLTVEAGGRVRSVQPAAARAEAPSLEKKTESSADVAAAPADVLRELRFAPGDRPRRLLVRVR